MSDATHGVLTTQKVQAAIDAELVRDIRTRRDLAMALQAAGEKISHHGVEAWFRHVDSNYNTPRTSLLTDARTYKIPRKRWQSLLNLFDIRSDTLQMSDTVFQKWCVDRAKSQRTEDWTEFPPRPSSLIGRESIYREFGVMISEILDGNSTTFVVEGDPGVGKSFLLDHLLRSLEGSPIRHFRSAAVEDAQIPLMPIFDWCQQAQKAGTTPLTEELTIERLAIQDNRAEPKTVEKMAGNLLTLNDGKPLVLVLDDAQWADELTLQALKRISHSRILANQGLGIVIALRSSKSRPSWIGGLTKSSQWHALAPFSEMEVRQFVTLLSNRDPATSLVKLLHTQSMGMPLFTELLYQALVRDHLLYEKNGAVYTDESPEQLLGRSDIHHWYTDRIEHMPKEVQDLIQHLAAFNKPFNIDLLEAFFPNTPSQTIFDLLEEAEAQGVLSYQSDRFTFRHATIRRAIYDTMSDVHKARVHATLALALIESQNATPYVVHEIADQLLKASGFVANETIADYCYRAAQSSRRLQAWDQLLHFADGALKHAKSLTKQQESDLLTWTGSAQHLRGFPHEAIRVLTRAYEQIDADENAAGKANALAQIVRIRGNFGLVKPDELSDVRLLERLLTQLDDAHQISRVHDALSARYSYAGQPVKAQEHSIAAHSILEQEKPSEAKTLAALGAGVACLNMLQLSDAARYLTECEETAFRCQSFEHVDRARQRLALVHLLRGDFERLDQTEQRLRSSGAIVEGTGEFTLVLAAKLGSLAIRGRYEEAEAIYSEGLALARESGYIWGVPVLICGIAGARYETDPCMVKNAIEDWLSFDLKTFGYVADLLYRLIEDNASPSMLQNGHELVQDLSRYDPLQLSLLGLQSTIGIHTKDTHFLQGAIPVFEAALKKGIHVTLGWPVLIPELLSRMLSELGHESKANKANILAEYCRTQFLRSA